MGQEREARGLSERFWAAVVFVMAAAVGLCTLGKPLHFDEAVQIYIVRQPLETLFSLVLNRFGGGQMHLSGFIMHFLYAVSSHAIFLRVSMLGFYLAGLFVLYRVLRRITNYADALAAVALVALSEQYILRCAELRAYSMWLCFCMLSVYCFVRLLSAPSSRWYAAWAAASLLMLYTHYFGMLMLVVEAVVWLLFFRPLRLRPAPFLAAVGSMALAAFPLKYFLFEYCVKEPDQLRYYSYANPQWQDVYDLFYDYCGHPVFMACAAFLIIAGIFIGIRTISRRRDPLSLALKSLGVLGFVLPVGAVFFLRPWGVSFFREERFLLPYFVFFFMLLSWSLMRLPRTVRKWFIPVLFSLLVVNGVRHGIRIGTKPDPVSYTQVAAYIDAHRQPQDTVVTRNMWSYLQIFNELRIPYAFLADREEIESALVYRSRGMDRDKLYLGPESLTPLTRVWCVAKVGGPPLPWFDRDPRVVLKERTTIGNTEIRLYDIIK
jgi:hypothetical protein